MVFSQRRLVAEGGFNNSITFASVNVQVTRPHPPSVDYMIQKLNFNENIFANSQITNSQNL